MMNEIFFKVLSHTNELVKISLFRFSVHLSFAQIINMDVVYTMYSTGHMEIVILGWKLEF